MQGLQTERKRSLLQSRESELKTEFKVALFVCPSHLCQREGEEASRAVD